MGDRSSIEWTDATWSPIRARVGGAISDPLNLATSKIGWHCEHVSEGCRNCYAESINRRLGTGLDFKPGHRADIEIFLDEQMLLAPLRWKKPRRIFVNSMTDTFAEFVKDEWLDRMFAVMALAPQHTCQVLTKRPERMRKYVGERHSRNEVELAAERIKPSKGFPVSPKWCFDWPLPNVWLGVSAEDQATADERIPLLLQTPAAVRFVSLEPLLGPIDLSPKADASYQRLSEWYGPDGFDGSGSQPRRERRRDLFPNLHWVIVGGESGPHARPMHPNWARSLRDQCASAGAPYFFKQWGEWRPHANDYPRNAHRAGIIYPDGCFVRRGLGDATGEGGADMFMAGKKAAGRLLDGVEHNSMPGAAS